MPYNPSPAILDWMRKLGHQVAMDRPWVYIGIAPDFSEDWFLASCCPKRDPNIPLVVGANDWESRGLSVVLQKFRNGRLISMATQQPSVFFAGRCSKCGTYYWSAWDPCCREWEEDETPPTC